MYDFLLQSSLFLSLGALIYLMARAVPRVDESGEARHPAGRFDRMLSKLPLREIDEKLDLVFEKILRRLKIIIMKSDNLINEYLGKVKKSNGVNEKKPDLFQELNGDKKE